MKASELKAIVALLNHNRAAPIVNGCCFTHDLIFRHATVDSLLELKLIVKETSDLGEVINLTNIGAGVAKTFKNRSIHGYD